MNRRAMILKWPSLSLSIDSQLLSIDMFTTITMEGTKIMSLIGVSFVKVFRRNAERCFVYTCRLDSSIKWEWSMSSPNDWACVYRSYDWLLNKRSDWNFYYQFLHKYFQLIWYVTALQCTTGKGNCKISLDFQVLYNKLKTDNISGDGGQVQSCWNVAQIVFEWWFLHQGLFFLSKKCSALYKAEKFQS